MTDDELVARIEESFEKDDEQLEDDLPDLLDALEGQTDDLARAHPALVSKMLGRMQAMDIASFVSENPETADQFQDLLWSGVRVLAENDDELGEQIDETITVNFEADDCPMTGHLKTDEEAGTVTGGAGHLDDSDLTITGPADTLVGLITGSVDPIQGFMQQRYEMDGPVHKGTRLAPIMNSLSEKAETPQ